MHYFNSSGMPLSFDFKKKKVGKGSFLKDKNTFSQTFFQTKSENIFKEMGEAHFLGFD